MNCPNCEFYIPFAKGKACKKNKCPYDYKDKKVDLIKILIQELKEVVFYDLEALKDSRFEKNKDFDYHFKLLEGNLKDLFKLLRGLKNE